MALILSTLILLQMYEPALNTEFMKFMLVCEQIPKNQVWLCYLSAALFQAREQISLFHF